MLTSAWTQLKTFGPIKANSRNEYFIGRADDMFDANKMALPVAVGVVLLGLLLARRVCGFTAQSTFSFLSSIATLLF